MLLKPAALLLLLSPAAGWSQQPTNCGGLQFRTAIPITDPSQSASRTVLARTPDGTYSGLQLTPTPTGLRLIKQLPDYGKQLARCVPITTAPSRRPALPGPAILDPALTLLPSGNFQTTTLPGGGSAAAFNVEQVTYSPQFEKLSSRIFRLPTAAATISLADVNNDGLPDLLATDFFCVIHTCGGFRIYPGIPDGGFSTTATQVFPTPLVPLLVTDSNGDGLPDIFIISRSPVGNGFLQLARGKPDGSLAPPVPVFSGPEPIYRSLALADLNRDGIPDLIVSSNAGLYLALATTPGKFTAPVKIADTTDSPILGDLNGDGIPDIAAGSTVLLSDGNGGIAARTDYLSSPAVYIADVNSDGIPDIVGSSDILFGLGQGRFYAPIQVPTDTKYLSADLDGDGVPELIAVTRDRITVSRVNPDSTIRPFFTYKTGPPDFPAFGPAQVGDFNGDGKPDIVFTSQTASGASLVTLINDGNGGFRPLTSPALPGAAAMVAGDWNQDGKTDIAYVTVKNFSDSDNLVVVQLARADGSFAAPIAYLNFQPSTGLVAGRFKGSPNLDLLVHRSGDSPALALFPGKGDGTFLLGSPIDLPKPASYLGMPFTADFNGDGRPDLAFGFEALLPSPVSGVAILLNRRDGTFAAIVAPILDSPQAALDLDGDGVPDLIGTAAYYPGNGDGTFSPATLLPWSQPLAFGNFTGTGKVDVLAVSQNRSALFKNESTDEPTLLVTPTGRKGPLAPESLGTLRGTRFTAPSGDTVVTVTDSAGTERTAVLLLQTATRINFQVPAGTAPGTAAVRIRPAVGPTQATAADIATVAPALFIVHAFGNETDVAVGSAIRVEPDGTETVLPLTNQFNLTGAKSSYLSLYGSGVRNAAGAVHATIDGLPAPVTFAGPAPGFLGVDQINIQVPDSLQSYYRVLPIALESQGRSSNTVFVSVIK